MEFNTSQIDALCKNWKPGNELEANVTFPVGRVQFSKTLSHFIKLYGGCITEDEVMDVSFGDHIRYTLMGKSNIAAYCKTNKLTGVSALEKVRRGSAADVKDYGFRVRLSQETSIPVPLNLASDIRDTRKHFRLKKRYSIMTADNYRLDFTITRSAEGVNLAHSGLTKQPERYEIEVEYVGKMSPKADKMLDLVAQLVRVLKDQVYLISTSEQEAVVASYMALTGQQWNDRFFKGNPKRFFVAPQPVTLEIKNVLPSQESNVTSILTNYSVTEKASGERAVCFIDDNGKAYLINNRMVVTRTDLTFTVKNCILDCEKVRNPDGTFYILCFDCFYSDKGDPVFKENLVKRLEQLNRVIKAVKAPNDNYQVLAKNFLITSPDKDIFSLCARVLSNQYPYETDGLIFTPVSLAVGQVGNGPATLGKTWNQVFKWKPPEENTIDFLVKESADLSAGFATFDMYVSGTAGSAAAYFEMSSSSFVAQLFVPNDERQVLQVKLDSGRAKCMYGDEIMDGYVVEASYDMNDAKWIARRVRYDKIEESKMSNNRVTANSMSTALSVWNSIVYPITERHITGKEKLVMDKMKKDNTNKYYVLDDDGESKADTLTQSMAKFHNYWVKNVSLIARFKDTSTSLFDVSCGKGGDLYKWADNGFTTVVGVDIVEDNIVNDKNGIYQRLFQKKSIRIPDYKYAFVPLDSSIAWGPQIANIKDAYLCKVAKTLWDIEPGPDTLKHLQGIAAKPTFDVASCQFALHYFFKDGSNLDALLKNVDSILRPGGCFIGTCFDGERVNAFLGEEQERKGTIADKTIWSIKKGYDKFSKKKFGQTINVYVDSINREHEEYLVPYDLLVARAQEHGLRPLTESESKRHGFNGASMGSFQDLFLNMANDTDTSPSVKKALAMSDDEKAFSFLNMWFVFIKDFKGLPSKAAAAAASASSRKK